MVLPEPWPPIELVETVSSHRFSVHHPIRRETGRPGRNSCRVRHALVLPSSDLRAGALQSDPELTLLRYKHGILGGPATTPSRDLLTHPRPQVPQASRHVLQGGGRRVPVSCRTPYSQALQTDATLARTRAESQEAWAAKGGHMAQGFQPDPIGW